MGQVPQCTGRLCWEKEKSIFQISTLICLSSVSICNLLTDLPSYVTMYWAWWIVQTFLKKLKIVSSSKRYSRKFCYYYIKELFMIIPILF
jgi:hypothetical protein